MIAEIMIDRALMTVDAEKKNKGEQLTLFNNPQFLTNSNQNIVVGINGKELTFKIQNNTLMFDGEIAYPTALSTNKNAVKNAVREYLKLNNQTKIDYIVDTENCISYYHHYDVENTSKKLYLYGTFLKLIISDHELSPLYVKQYQTSDFNKMIEFIEDNYDIDSDDVLFTPSLKAEAVEYHYLYPYVNNPEKWEEVEKRFFIEE